MIKNYITEDEKSRILNLHNKFRINEQNDNQVDYTIRQLQELLNNKEFNVGKADGYLGPNTLRQIKAALDVIFKNKKPELITPAQDTSVNVTQQSVDIPAANYAFNPSALNQNKTK